MMSLIETNVLAVAKKQYSYKLKSYINLFYYLAIVQILSLMLSLNGISSRGIGGNNFNVDVNIYSNAVVIGFTMCLVFIIGIVITTEEYKNIDFTFVSNRNSSSLSSIGFLLTYSVVAAITAALNGNLLRVIMYYTRNNRRIQSEDFFVSPHNLITSIIAITLYLVLLSAISYFTGTLVQQHKAWIIFIGTFFIGIFMLAKLINSQINIFLVILNFFINESSLLLFTLKVIITATTLFLSGTLLLSRMEVKK